MEMRRKDRQLSVEETRAILEKGEYGVLCTVSEDGIPYGAPMSYVLVEDKIYMHCSIAGGLRMNNIAVNKNVSFTVACDMELLPDKFATKYYSAIVSGTAEVVESEEEKKQALIEVIKKYSPAFMESGKAYIDQAIAKTAVIKINISEMTGKARKN